jgi:hypothetical protein
MGLGKARGGQGASSLDRTWYIMHASFHKRPSVPVCTCKWCKTMSRFAQAKERCPSDHPHHASSNEHRSSWGLSCGILIQEMDRQPCEIRLSCHDGGMWHTLKTRKIMGSSAVEAWLTAARFHQLRPQTWRTATRRSEGLALLYSWRTHGT